MPSASLRVVLGLASVLAAGGCSDRFIVQDGVIANRFDHDRFWAGHTIDLHSPYLRGAGIGFLVTDSLHTVDFEGWTVESEDPSIAEVLEVDRTEVARSPRLPDVPQDALIAGILAVDVGETTIVVRDRQGDIRARAPFEVAAPSRIQLLAAAPLVVAPETQEEVTRPRIVAGGAGTFLVRYFDGDRLLHGKLNLAAAPPPGLEGFDVEGIHEVEAGVFPFRFLTYDWVRVRVLAEGTFPIELTADGALVHQFEVEAVAPTEVASLELHAVDEDEVAVGEHRRMALRALDGAHEPIYGVEAQWWRDERPIDEESRGDILSYVRDAGEPVTLSARFEGLTISAPIHGDAFSISSSNDVEESSCSIGERRGAPWLWLLLVGVVARRRRRSAGRAAGAPPSPPARALPSP